MQREVDDEEFDEEPAESRAHMYAERLGRELLLGAESDAREQQVGDERHHGYVQVGRIHVELGRYSLRLAILTRPILRKTKPHK